MKQIHELDVKLFADGADLAGIAEMAAIPYIQGFTTNPTLMRKAGVTDYKKFAEDALRIVGTRPISFEVFADDFETIEKQALEIASWGDNVYVKIPVTNTKGEFAGGVIRTLTRKGVKLNVTALLTLEQVHAVTEELSHGVPAIVSVFAGRIADTGVDPIPVMEEAVKTVGKKRGVELIWASPRELLNVYQADAVGCHIITATTDILKKISLIGKDLSLYSLETVQMFYRDATEAGFTIKLKE